MFSFAKPKPFDVKSKSKEELIALFENRGRQGDVPGQREVVREMWRRGYSVRKYCRVLPWTPDRVNGVMEGFVEVSQRCKDSLRTDFSEAGGGVFKASDHPEARWVDTYTGVEVKDFNATFSCHIREPGDEPEFILNVKSSNAIETFSYDEIDAAMKRWVKVVSIAIEKLQ